MLYELLCTYDVAYNIVILTYGTIENFTTQQMPNKNNESYVLEKCTGLFIFRDGSSRLLLMFSSFFAFQWHVQ